ncbi:MAG: hypothetical protein U0841_04870 [Chloroflexia bacterium]
MVERLRRYAYFYNHDPAGLRHLPGGEWRSPSADEVAAVSDELTDFGRHVRRDGVMLKVVSQEGRTDE